MTAKDATGKTATAAQSINVGGTTMFPGFALSPISTALFVIAGIFAMAFAVTFYLARYHRENRRLMERFSAAED